MLTIVAALEEIVFFLQFIETHDGTTNLEYAKQFFHSGMLTCNPAWHPSTPVTDA
jgi:hypothetical protein